jgi:hypothetical protein
MYGLLRQYVRCHLVQKPKSQLTQFTPQLYLEKFHYIYPCVLLQQHISMEYSHAQWVTDHAFVSDTMSTSEQHEYGYFLQNPTLVMLGHLGVKETLHSMYA